MARLQGQGIMWFTSRAEAFVSKACIYRHGVRVGFFLSFFGVWGYEFACVLELLSCWRKERVMAQKNSMARKPGALSHMTRTCKTVEPFCFPSCPSWTYSFYPLAFLEFCIAPSRNDIVMNCVKVCSFMLEKFNCVAFSC